MEQVLEKQQTETPAQNIPAKFIYEIIDGRPIYYAGYKDVLNKEKTIDEIMGSSSLQSTIIDLIIKFFHKIEFDGNLNYRLFYSEVGLHAGKKNNIAADIAIYKASDIRTEDISDSYLSKPPRVVIEVDTKASVSDVNDVLEYMETKTEKLLQFGTEKILWILTKRKKIIVITDSKQWYFADWDETIRIIDDIDMSIDTLMKKNE